MKTFDLNVRVEAREKNYSIIELAGFLDAHTVNTFEAHLDEILQEGPNRIVIDMSQLIYISSAGIGTLMALTQRLRKGMGDMVLLQPNDKVYKILDLLGFTKIFNVALKEEEIEAFFTPT